MRPNKAMNKAMNPTGLNCAIGRATSCAGRLSPRRSAVRWARREFWVDRAERTRYEGL